MTFWGLKTLKQLEGMKELAESWNKSNKLVVNGRNVVESAWSWWPNTNSIASTLVETLQKLVRIKGSAQNHENLLPAFFLLFHFRGSKTWNYWRKQLAVGTVYYCYISTHRGWHCAETARRRPIFSKCTEYQLSDPVGSSSSDRTLNDFPPTLNSATACPSCESRVTKLSWFPK